MPPAHETAASPGQPVILGCALLGNSRGEFSVELELAGAAAGPSAVIRAVVDTGIAYTAIPESVLHALGVQPVARRKFLREADGRQVEGAVGEVRIRYGDMAHTSPVMFAPDDAAPRLGRVTLQIFQMAADPARERLVPLKPLLREAVTRPNEEKRRYEAAGFDAKGRSLRWKGKSRIGVSVGLFAVDIQVTEIFTRQSAVVNAVVDTGAAHTVIPEDILNGLGVMPVDSEFYELADGREVELYDADIMVSYNGRRPSPVKALFGPEGCQPVLGASALQVMDLMVDNKNERLAPTPPPPL